MSMTSRPAGRPPRAKRAPGTSREELLDAAARVFARDGYEQATVAAIVDEAGLSKGTFYWNFPSKQAVFEVLLEERLDRPVQVLMDVIRQMAPADLTAERVGAGLTSLARDDPEAVRLHHEHAIAALRDRGYAATYCERQDALRDHLADALSARHGQVGPPLTLSAVDLATAFLALVHGLSFQALVRPGSVDAGLFGHIAALVHDGLVHRDACEAGPDREPS